MSWSENLKAGITAAQIDAANSKITASAQAAKKGNSNMSWLTDAASSANSTVTASALGPLGVWALAQKSKGISDERIGKAVASTISKNPDIPQETKDSIAASVLELEKKDPSLAEIIAKSAAGPLGWAPEMIAAKAEKAGMENLASTAKTIQYASWLGGGLASLAVLGYFIRSIR